MDFSTLIKKLDENLTLIDTSIVDNTIYITCSREKYDAVCPFCNEKSNSIHSTYIRTIKDLPIQEYQVKLKIIAHKYFCNNTNCKHKTFAERFSFIEQNAVRTNRLTEFIKKIAVRNSGMDTVRDLKDNSIITSVNTVLRILKKKGNEIDYSIHKNIGIDDFSTKKREKYGTIITDNDSKKKINIIKNRDKESVKEELKKFTNVETVTRDLSSTYKAAIEEALPKAKQIADRFHIEQNFTDDIIDYMNRTISEKIVLNNKNDANIELSSYEKKKEETALKKWKKIKEVKKLKKKNLSNVEIGERLDICAETVAKYLKITKLPIQSSHSKLDAFIPDIKQAIIENKTKKQIYEYIKSKGYTGKSAILYHRLKSIRSEVKNNLITIKKSQLKKILFVDDIENIKNYNIKYGITLYLQQNEEFNKLVELLREFKTILFSKNPDLLDSWLEKSKLLEIPELTKFVNTIENDIDAVKNAIIYDYSNGLTEGFNNKTKVIKREMYGRCSFDLLRIKILA